MNRRLFLGALGGAALAAAPFDVAAFERKRVLTAAARYLKEQPVTVTANRCERSHGGLHDFYSEGDYWWPDPANPGAPYIQRDGMTNPANFVAHRQAMMRLSVHVPALTAAWKLTNDARYSEHALRHLRAWFVDPPTRMNPNLEYAQAIKGRATGRGTGIIDTIHLVEVARSAILLNVPEGVREWFAQYLQWLTTHDYGTMEREAKNNHGTCWVMQVAAFAAFTKKRALTDYCIERFKTVLIPDQMARDGSFPLEMKRTKPYGYSLFNLEAMSATAEILSTHQDNLWTFQLPDGRGLKKAMEFMVPYIADKKQWPHSPDVMYDKEWPMRQSSLLFAGRALNRPDYIELWKKLPADSDVEEVIRNFFIRQPVIWLNTEHS